MALPIITLSLGFPDLRDYKQTKLPGDKESKELYSLTLISHEADIQLEVQLTRTCEKNIVGLVTGI